MHIIFVLPSKRAFSDALRGATLKKLSLAQLAYYKPLFYAYDALNLYLMQFANFSMHFEGHIGVYSQLNCLDVSILQCFSDM